MEPLNGELFNGEKNIWITIAKMEILSFITITIMYKLSEIDVRRIITACEKYAHDTGSEWMHDEYITLTKKLCQYLEQNFDHLDKPPVCKIYDKSDKNVDGK